MAIVDLNITMEYDNIKVITLMEPLMPGSVLIERLVALSTIINSQPPMDFFSYWIDQMTTAGLNETERDGYCSGVLNIWLNKALSDGGFI